MQLCNKCVLTENFPRTKFDASGVCNFCNHSQKNENQATIKKRYKDKFKKLILQHKGKGDYDCVVAFSGGKDSTYTLQLMKNEYDLNILAISLNNWFQSDTAIENIHRMIKQLSVDHLTFLPNFDAFREMILASTYRDFYPLKTLERATAICTTCLSLIRFACFKIAIEKNIPFIVFGLSPGQAPIVTSVFKTNADMLRKMQNAILNPMQRYVGDIVNGYFLNERHFEKKANFPHSINPLAFIDYDETLIYESIKPLGWQPPEDTDSNSTNCLLNGFANMVHMERHGYHPYAMELAEFVREGILSRKDALHRLSQKPDHRIIEQIKTKLGLSRQVYKE